MFGKLKQAFQSKTSDASSVQEVEVWTASISGFASVEELVSLAPVSLPAYANDPPKTPARPNEYAKRVGAPSMGQIVPFLEDDYPRKYCVVESRYDYDLDREVFPEPTDLPDFFHLYSGTMCMKRHLAEIFLQHNLGKSHLFPVFFFQHDRITPIPGEYFALYFGEAQKAVSFDDCLQVAIFESYAGPLIKKARFKGEFAIRRSSLNALDLWIDSQCFSSFFMSARLKKALDAAGLKQRDYELNFYPCRMI
jgi:hypothetical protein